jgi:superfamily I DNA/RNA helicase
MANETTGVYTIHMIDVDRLKRTQELKQSLTENFSSIQVYSLKHQLNDLYSDMYMTLDKYFPDELAKHTTEINGKKFTFIQLKSIAPSLNDRETIRRIFEEMSGIYEHFAKQLKAALPTQRS